MRGRREETIELETFRSLFLFHVITLVKVAISRILEAGSHLPDYISEGITLGRCICPCEMLVLLKNRLTSSII